jgi:hypothetical protein
MDHELVLIDQSQLRQRQRKLHASHEYSPARLLLDLLNSLPQISALQPPRSNRPRPGCSTRHTSLPHRSSGRTEPSIRPSNPASLRSPTAGVLSPSSRRLPRPEEGHRPALGPRPNSDATLHPWNLPDDRSAVESDVDGIPQGLHQESPVTSAADGLLSCSASPMMMPSGPRRKQSR